MAPWNGPDDICSHRPTTGKDRKTDGVEAHLVAMGTRLRRQVARRMRNHEAISRVVIRQQLQRRPISSSRAASPRVSRVASVFPSYHPSDASCCNLLHS